MGRSPLPLSCVNPTGGAVCAADIFCIVLARRVLGPRVAWRRLKVQAIPLATHPRHGDVSEHLTFLILQASQARLTRFVLGADFALLFGMSSYWVKTARSIVYHIQDSDPDRRRSPRPWLDAVVAQMSVFTILGRQLGSWRSEEVATWRQPVVQISVAGRGSNQMPRKVLFTVAR